MWWKFWERENKVLNKIEEMEEKIIITQDSITDLSNVVKQMTRLQYKSSQESKKLLTDISGILEKQQKDRDLIEQLEKKLERHQTFLDNNKNTMINFIDEMDLVKEGLKNSNDSWEKLFKNWIGSLLQQLQEQGIYQLDLLNKEFNPRLADAVDVVSKKVFEEKSNSEREQTYRNYHIVEVVKRGYQNDKGSLIRKASVVVYKEEDNE